MTPISKALFFSAGIALMAGVSAIWWVHKRESIESKRLSDAATETRTRADQGDVMAESKLALMYYKGKGVPKDYAKAASLYREAAEKGYARAQFNLGDLYFRGEGVPQDYAEAVYWTRKAADQGDAKAQVGLGYMYSNGVGLPQDYAEALNCYRKAAEQGDAAGQHALGYMYFNGQGVPQNYAQAFQWIQKAADQGDAEAQSALGYMYAKGQGVTKDRTEALRWYRKAAEQGNPEAKRALELSGSGSGVLTETRWFELVTVLLGVPVGLWAFLASLFPGKKLPRWRQAAIMLLGVSFLLNAGLSLYAFAHGAMRYSPYRDAFHLARLLLNAIAILIILTVVLPAKKDAPSS
jgi:TPR repeat protein